MNLLRVEIVHLNETKSIPVESPFFDLAPHLRFGCRAGACGSCAIRILEGHENLSLMGEKEKKGLERMNLFREGIRLACQTKILGSCKITSVNLRGGSDEK